MTNTQASSGPGFFSKLFVLALFGVAIWLYLQIVMVEGKAVNHAPLQQVSVPVVEGNEPVPSRSDAPLRELPADQMALIMQVFAPQPQK
jgi:hypothetical protein